MSDLPQVAVDAVERALTLYLLPYDVPQGDIHNAAIIAVRDAAPHIAAGERERVIAYRIDGCDYHPSDVTIICRERPSASPEAPDAA
jgi:hypothetical protein